MYPAFAVIASDPLVVIFVFVAVGVDLLAELAVEVVIVVFIAIFAEEAVFVVLYSGPDFFVNFF